MSYMEFGQLPLPINNVRVQYLSMKTTTLEQTHTHISTLHSIYPSIRFAAAAAATAAEIN